MSMVVLRFERMGDFLSAVFSDLVKIFGYPAFGVGETPMMQHPGNGFSGWTRKD
jgi:hypothetical protein